MFRFFIFREHKIRHRFILCAVLLLLSSVLIAETASAQTDYVPPTFDEKCPSSEERAKLWNVARLLKPEDLAGSLAFLNVPYPQRDPREIEKNLAQYWLGELQERLAPYEEKRSQSTVYPEYRFWPGMWRLLSKHTSSYRSHLFVIDEGCANLTVIRVGLRYRLGFVADVNVMRAFDDYNFAQRKLPFHFEYFDGIFKNPAPLGVNGMPIVPYYTLANVALMSALKNMDGGATLENMKKLLAAAGVSDIGDPRFNAATGETTYITEYTPTYRPPAAPAQFSGRGNWTINFRISETGYVTHAVASVPSGPPPPVGFWFIPARPATKER